MRIVNIWNAIPDKILARNVRQSLIIHIDYRIDYRSILCRDFTIIINCYYKEIRS